MRWWQNQDPISRLSIGIIATNGAVHLGRFVAPGYWGKLWHTPIRNVNYTILTSTFVHSGPFHLFFNMWACYNFLLPTGYSRAFEGNPYHLGAFFVTTGILSGYAQHLSTIFSNTAKALQTGFPPAKVFDFICTLHLILRLRLPIKKNIN
jgi:rhomboid-like protein